MKRKSFQESESNTINLNQETESVQSGYGPNSPEPIELKESGNIPVKDDALHAAVSYILGKHETED